MRRRTVWIILSAAVVTALVVAGAVVWFNAKAYDDTVAACARALEQRADCETARPSECRDVKQDDYDALAIAQVLKDSGMVDDDGNVDLGRVLDQP